MLFSQFKLGKLGLANRMVMAPMTRSRATENTPNALMTEYYAMRAEAGLLITEGVAPSIHGVGYPRIPGIYNPAQIEGWRHVTEAVHKQGGKIFIQLMHTGRISHPENMDSDAVIMAPSAIKAAGEIFTDTKGLQEHPVPKEMTLADIDQAKQEFIEAAKNAISAGFDGIEIHGANGYLIDQFINPGSNQRTDDYGGNTEDRSRFAIEVASGIAGSIGAERTGIRLSPYGVYNDMMIFDDIENTYEYLASELAKLNLAYIHIVDHSSQGAPTVPDSIKDTIRTAFGGTIIASGGLDKEKAEAILQSGKAELTAFGQLFLANPDLVYRFRNDLELNSPDYATFFTPGEQGYLDYTLAK